jgi:hypothetical protein
MHDIPLGASIDRGILAHSHRSSDEAAAIIAKYLGDIVSPLQSYGRGFTQTWRQMVPTSVRTKVRCVLTDVLSMRERRTARKLMRCTRLRVHLGSGDRPKSGWVNVDLLGHHVDLAWNLNRALPFEDGSVESVRSYCDTSGDFLEKVRPGRPTPMLALQEEFYWHGHQTMYDFETLALVCKAAGFESIERRGFGDTRLTPIPDSDFRRLDTLYVEMVR